MKINNTSSFRDPSGFVYTDNGTLFRQINIFYKHNYDHLLNSGLYSKLVEEQLLIPHEERSDYKNLDQNKYKIIQPEKIPFISYPYEWCFGQWKEAALLTLRIQKIALSYGMTLKDTSAFNIQFKGYQPILIDTLSFEMYDEGKPWIAYRQFAEHFLSPLALMSHTDGRLGRLLTLNLGGVPLDLAVKLLPLKARFNPGLFFHIYLHAWAQSRYKTPNSRAYKSSMSKFSLLGLIDNLENTVHHLSWRIPQTTWGNYYDDRISYTPASQESKKSLLEKLLTQMKPTMVWDIGANTGFFSRLASKLGAYVISSDIDLASVEKNYHHAQLEKESLLLPLFLDITNPTPSVGWDNAERDSFFKRGPTELMMALALIHHLAIGNNLPMSYIAETFAHICQKLIIEFIPKDDPMTQRLLAQRDDIFPNYTQKHFENIFQKFFTIKRATPIKGSKRTLYTFENNFSIVSYL